MEAHLVQLLSQFFGPKSQQGGLRGVKRDTAYGIVAQSYTNGRAVGRGLDGDSSTSAASIISNFRSKLRVTAARGAMWGCAGSDSNRVRSIRVRRMSGCASGAV